MTNSSDTTIRKSRLVDGIVIPPTHLELIAVDHCNISCGSCNHASPAVPTWFANPETVFKDFSVLAKNYRPAFVKVIGGEPLLHKKLDEVIRAARASGISNHFTLVTNGILLHKASDALWEDIDEIEISIYPGMDKTMENIVSSREKALSMGKKLTIFKYDKFRETFSSKGTADQELINKIYAACKVANFWGCHAVRDGYIYKCPQSIYIPTISGTQTETDRLEIVDDDNFAQTLLDFLNSTTPLTTCANCAGTAGRLKAHEFLPLEKWHKQINKSSEEIIDYDWLARCLITQSNNDDCKIPMRFKVQHIQTWFPFLKYISRLAFSGKAKNNILTQDKRSVEKLTARKRRSR